VAGKPELRAVPPTGGEGAGASPGPQNAGGERDRVSWLSIALAVALAFTIVLLVWSRLRLTERIESLEAEIGELRDDVAARDMLIDAQRERLGEVRRRVGSLMKVLEEPLPTVD